MDLVKNIIGKLDDNVDYKQIQKLIGRQFNIDDIV